MAIVRHTAGKELAPEKLAVMKAEIEAATRLPYVHDPDSPLLTETQLGEFHPVGGISWEERERRMKAAGITNP